MTDVLNWLGALKTPDIAGAFDQGAQNTQATQAGALKLQEARSGIADKDQLRALAPQIFAGDPDALAQSTAIDPESTAKVSALAQQQNQLLYQGATALTTAYNDGTPEGKKKAGLIYHNLVPVFRQTHRGVQIPDELDDATAQQIAAIGAVQPVLPKGTFSAPFLGQDGNMYVRAPDGTVRNTGVAGAQSFNFAQDANGNPINQNRHTGAVGIAPQVGQQPEQQGGTITTDTPIPQDEQAAAAAVIQGMADHPGQPISVDAVNGGAVPVPQGNAIATTAPVIGGPIKMAAKGEGKTTFRPATPEEVKAQGFPDGTQALMGSDGMVRLPQGQTAVAPANSRNQAGTDPLSGLSAQDAALVKNLATYKALPSDLGRAANRADLMARAQLLNPDYNVNNAKEAQAYLTDLAKSGPTSAGGQAAAANTALSHLGLMLKANADLQTGSYRVLTGTINAASNAMKTGAGATAVTSWNQQRGFVSQEMAKLLKGGVATQEEYRDIMGGLDPNGSPQQRNKGLLNAVEYMHGRIQVLDERGQRLLGSMHPGTSLLSQEAESVIRRSYKFLGHEDAPDMLPSQKGGSYTRNSTTPASPQQSQDFSHLWSQ